MPSDHGGVACPKPLPRKVAKLGRQKANKREDDKARDKVRERYKRRCCVCGRKTNVVHEHKRRGAGGTVSLQNSFLGCDVIDGGLCHPLLQGRQIEPMAGAVPLVVGEDVRTITGFRMTADIHKLVFKHRGQPSHIQIVE